MRIFLIGPGGAGKSTVGKILAEKTGWKLVDLDKEFNDRIGNIGEFLNKYDYEKYCLKNSKLFYSLVEKYTNKAMFVLSSGFLVHEGHNDLVEKHKRSIQKLGTSVLLLPSRSLGESEEIIVNRQMRREFELTEGNERRKIRRRFPKYNKMGDIRIFSKKSPEMIARKVIYKLRVRKII